MGLGFTVVAVAVTVDLVLEAAATPVPAPVPVLPSAPAASVFRAETLSLLDIIGEGMEVVVEVAVAGVPATATFVAPDRGLTG